MTDYRNCQEDDDQLREARGILFALVLNIPIWLLLALVVWRLLA